MSTTKMSQMILYFPPEWKKKMLKKRGSRGLISNSEYLRYLVNKDIAGM